MAGSKHVVGLSKLRRNGYLDRTSESLQRTYDYCEQDVLAEQELRGRVGPLTPGEHKVWLLDQRVNERGIGLDMDFVAQSSLVIERASKPLIKEFRDITGVNPSQRDKFLGWLVAENVPIDNLQKKTIDKLIGESDDDTPYDGDWDAFDEPSEPEADVHGEALSPHVRRALEVRRLLGSASIKKLGRMRECVCADGRARGLVQYHAAQTGRFGGRILQPHNFPIAQIMVDDEPAEPWLAVEAIMTGDPEYVQALVGEPISVVVASLRHALAATKQRVKRLFVAADFSGVEARIIYAFSGQHDKAALLASGADVYADLASQIYGRPINKKNDPVERDIGKHAVLGLDNGMGWQEFEKKYAPGQPDLCKRVVHTYRKEWAPMVPKLWYGLEEAAARAVWDGTPQNAYGITYMKEDAWLTARLPSGRRLWYYNPQPVQNQAPWDPLELRPGWTYQAQRQGQWRTIGVYGSMLAAQARQGMARDLLVPAMFKCEREGLPVVLTVHDEIVTEPEESRADPKLLQQIMEDIPRWARELKFPIAAVPWAGDRYRK